MANLHNLSHKFLTVIALSNVLGDPYKVYAKPIRTLYIKTIKFAYLMTKYKNQIKKCKAFALQTETKAIAIRVTYEQMEFHPRKDYCVTILKSSQCGKRRN